VGAKRYELANHLGNVINIVSDRKIIDDKGANLYDTPSGKTNLSFNPEIIGYNDYYPFGMLVPNRYGQADSYRYGFNGKEKDDEIKGEGAQYDYGFRIYDPRLGKFLSTDPLFNTYPFYTPYQFAGNSPIMAVDLDGLEMKISNTELSCIQTSRRKSKIEISFDAQINIKVLNITSVKLEGFEKLADQASKEISKSFSDKKGLANFMSSSDLEGNDFSEAHNIEANGRVRKFDATFEVINSTEDINNNDYVLIVTDKALDGSIIEENGRIPRAYTFREGQAMIINIDDYNAKKNRSGNYDFNGGGKVVKDIANTVAHEFGHNLGLEDKYDEIEINGKPSTKAKKGFEKNRMGNSTSSAINSSQAKITTSFLIQFVRNSMFWDRKGIPRTEQVPGGRNGAKEDTQEILDRE
ncbi:RHS repeat domain-containing protein, partial [Tenacibaculum maritimum]